MKKEHLITALLITLICTLLLIVPLFMFPWALQSNVEHREIAGVVDEVNPATGCVTLVDAYGEAWVCEDADLAEGQPVIIVFNDMGTDDIYDDEIIQIIFEKGA
jgi:hypothetical protein